MIFKRTLSTIVKQSLQESKLPKVAVFDLDHTIWPFGIDSYRFIPPYHIHQGKVIDMCSQEIQHFKDIPKVFEYLHTNGVKIAVASRTRYPTGAYRVLELFKFDRFIQYYHIYPGQKMKHFGRIKDESGAQYEEMIFFDDEERNIADIGPLGVLAILVDRDNGVTETVLQQSLEQYTEKSLKAEK